MVNDIRPEASALLRQIANISQGKVGPNRNAGWHGQSAPGGLSVSEGNSMLARTNKFVHATHQSVQLTHPKMLPEKGGVSVVEEVFNQIYSKSGFLKEEDVVPVKREQLGTRLDVYA